MNAAKFLALLGIAVTFKSGRLVASCPFALTRHGAGRDRHPSFSVMEREGYGAYYCFGCGASGNMAKLLSSMEELGQQSYVDARFELWCGDLGKQPKKRLDYAIGGVQVGAAQSIAQTQEWGSVFGVEHERKPSEPYRLPEESELERFSAELSVYAFMRGISQACWDRFGMREDVVRHRLVIPIRRRDGLLFGMTARLAWPQDYCFRCGEMIEVDGERLDRCPSKTCWAQYQKYLHTKGMPKGDVLFGAHLLESPDYLMVVEGALDATNVWQHGIANVVATLGTGVTEQQIELMAAYGCRVLVMGDGDKAGRQMNEFVEMRLRRLGREVDVVDLSDGVDPGGLGQEQVRTIVDRFGLTTV